MREPDLKKGEMVEMVDPEMNLIDMEFYPPAGTLGVVCIDHKDGRAVRVRWAKGTILSDDSESYVSRNKIKKVEE